MAGGGVVETHTLSGANRFPSGARALASSPTLNWCRRENSRAHCATPMLCCGVAGAFTVHDGVAAQQSWCGRRDSNPHCRVSETRASYRLGYVRVVVRRVGVEPTLYGISVRSLCHWSTCANWCGARDSNPQKTLGLSQPHMPFCYPRKMVAPRGADPLPSA